MDATADQILQKVRRGLVTLDAMTNKNRDAPLAGEELAAGPVRLGAFATAAAGLVPKAPASLPPEPNVTLREGTTPALTRALRAGTLDLAILALTSCSTP